jgi:hypothetical protein
MMDEKRPYLPQDFAACTNQACPVRQTCWRSWPNPDAKHQAFAHFTSTSDGCVVRLDFPKRSP